MDFLLACSFFTPQSERRTCKKLISAGFGAMAIPTGVVQISAHV
jgi:hypothetical protein